MNYKIRYVKYEGKINWIVFDFEKPYEILSYFISDDVSAFADWIREDFDEVLSGREEEASSSGNVCCWEITPTTTKVYNNLAQSDEEFYSTMCEVDTRELLQLVNESDAIIKEFKRKRDDGEFEKEEQQE